MTLPLTFRTASPELSTQNGPRSADGFQIRSSRLASGLARGLAPATSQVPLPHFGPPRPKPKLPSAQTIGAEPRATRPAARSAGRSRRACPLPGARGLPRTASDAPRGLAPSRCDSGCPNTRCGGYGLAPLAACCRSSKPRAVRDPASPGHLDPIRIVAAGPKPVLDAPSAVRTSGRRAGPPPRRRSTEVEPCRELGSARRSRCRGASPRRPPPGRSPAAAPLPGAPWRDLATPLRRRNRTEVRVLLRSRMTLPRVAPILPHAPPCHRGGSSARDARCAPARGPRQPRRDRRRTEVRRPSPLRLPCPRATRTAHAPAAWHRGASLPARSPTVPALRPRCA
jgi:hypothetical protein